MKLYPLAVLLCLTASLSAQSDRWQQAVDYTMRIDVDVDAHQYTGEQTLIYTNNSPDTSPPP